MSQTRPETFLVLDAAMDMRPEDRHPFMQACFAGEEPRNMPYTAHIAFMLAKPLLDRYFAIKLAGD